MITQKVITYTTTRWNKISLTANQVARMEQSGVTLRDQTGEPYCQVHMGLHPGDPTYTDAELEKELEAQGAK